MKATSRSKSERLRARLSFFEAAPCFRTVRHVLIAPPSTVVQLTSIRSERELVYVQEAAWRLGSLRPTCCAVAGSSSLRREQEGVRAACDRSEEFLSNTGTEIRDIIAIEMLESFPNAEYPSGSDTF